MLQHAEFDMIIREILQNDDFPMIPYQETPDQESVLLFNKMKTANRLLFVNHMFSFYDTKDLNEILHVYTHYTNKIDFMINDANLYFLELECFFEVHIFKALIQKYSLILLKQNNIDTIDQQHKTILFDACLNSDIDLYIDIMTKTNNGNIKSIWNRNKFKVFDFINKHKNKYEELKKLDEPTFIIENMNGYLDINEDTVRYLFEYASIHPNDIINLKRNLGFELIYKYNKHKFDDVFFIQIIENPTELKIFLQESQASFTTIEKTISILKNKFPASGEIIKEIVLKCI